MFNLHMALLSFTEAKITNDRDGDTSNMLNDDCSAKAVTPIEGDF